MTEHARLYMKSPSEDEKEWGAGSSAPTGNDEDNEDPEADEWYSKLEQIAENLNRWYARG